MKLAVGCPIKNRAWILPTWFHYIRMACEEIDVEPEFVFVVGTSEDKTMAMLGPLKHRTLIVNNEDPHDLPHQWNDMDRYGLMAEVRNMMLDAVRMMEADYFLSLDSDILIAPGVLPNLFETIETCDAVGGKLYMDRNGRFNPSYAMINPVNLSLQRPDQEGVFPVDVIMGMKLMTPAAYNVDYVAHFQGEDIGWSLNCRYGGLKFKWDGRIPSKHVIIPEMLMKPDRRVGY